MRNKTSQYSLMIEIIVMIEISVMAQDGLNSGPQML